MDYNLIMLLTPGHSHHRYIFHSEMGSYILCTHDLLLQIYRLNVDNQIWAEFLDL